MGEDIISVSLEKLKLEDDNTRMNLMGKSTRRSSLSSSNREEKLLPHYLRASTSSCHDFCKYGREHAFETRAKQPITRALVRNKRASLEGQNLTRSLNLEEVKKKLVTKTTVSPELKTELLDKPKVSKQVPLSPAKKVDISPKSAVVLKPKFNPKPVVGMSLSPSDVSGSSARRNSVNSASNLSGGSSGRSSERKPLTPSEGSIGRRSREGNPVNPSVGPSSRRNSDGKMVRTMGLQKNGEKGALKPPTLSVSPKPSVRGVANSKPFKFRHPKVASPRMNLKKLGRSVTTHEEVIEKTLYVIEPKPENSNLEPVQHDSHSQQSSSHSSSQLPSSPFSPSVSSHSLLSSHGEKGEECTESDSEHSDVDDIVSEQDETENENHGDISKGREGRARRSAVIHPEDKDKLPEKLKFRRGKVVSPQSENNGPRRLRFRQGRVVVESPNGKTEIGRRSFRKKRVSGDGDPNIVNDEAQTVVLRHQDVQGKKEEQGLLNEVIEETANKLVETRKSKVKALVGAFETVISLRESKPAIAG